MHACMQVQLRWCCVGLLAPWCILQAGVDTINCRLFACRDALRYIALREDFKTARVDGKPLMALFSGEGTMFE